MFLKLEPQTSMPYVMAEVIALDYEVGISRISHRLTKRSKPVFLYSIPCGPSNQVLTDLEGLPNVDAWWKSITKGENANVVGALLAS
jgi:hypothetical protein